METTWLSLFHQISGEFSPFCTNRTDEKDKNGLLLCVRSFIFKLLVFYNCLL